MENARIKYPRTPHLPYSPGANKDDRLLQEDHHFYGKEIVITEKMDGECTTLYPDGYTHARSLDSSAHASRDWIKGYWALRSYQLPEGYRICGENCFAKHSIEYFYLPEFFLAFSVWNNKICLSWEDTVKITAGLSMKTVPILFQGKYDADLITKLADKAVGEGKEGIVVRLKTDFDLLDFNKSIAKFVRKNHVQTEDHWMTTPLIHNHVQV